MASFTSTLICKLEKHRRMDALAGPDEASLGLECCRGALKTLSFASHYKLLP